MRRPRGRPRGPAEEARTLYRQGWRVKEIIDRLGYSRRAVSRWINERPDGARLEDSLLEGAVERANSQIESGRRGRDGDDRPGEPAGPLELDELIGLGVPEDQAPGVVASWDLARWRGMAGVLTFWTYTLDYLRDDPTTPWDVCIDLGLSRLWFEAIVDSGGLNLIGLLWRYKPWRGEQNRKLFVEMLRLISIGRTAADDEAERSWETDLLTARGLYVLIDELPRRLVTNYITAPSGFSLSLLLRGRKRQRPLKVSDAIEVAGSMRPMPSSGESNEEKGEQRP